MRIGISVPRVTGCTLGAPLRSAMIIGAPLRYRKSCPPSAKVLPALSDGNVITSVSSPPTNGCRARHTASGQVTGQDTGPSLASIDANHARRVARSSSLRSLGRRGRGSWAAIHLSKSNRKCAGLTGMNSDHASQRPCGYRRRLLRHPQAAASASVPGAEGGQLSAMRRRSARSKPTKACISHSGRNGPSATARTHMPMTATSCAGSSNSLRSPTDSQG
jgi:hypothetical protein